MEELRNSQDKIYYFLEFPSNISIFLSILLLCETTVIASTSAY